MISQLKSVARSALYWVGLLGLLHRIRNRRTLTVFMFHRVLPRDSEAFRNAEREFTFSTEGFADTLAFVERHYQVVDHQTVHKWSCGAGDLPSRAALITFDDGWRDTLTFALPILERYKMPSVLFLATEVIALESDRWWQDLLVERLQARDAIDRIEAQLQLPRIADSPRRTHAVVAAVAAMPAPQRNSFLGMADDALERQMLTRQDVNVLRKRMSIAGHGHTHAPLTAVADPMAELATSRQQLQLIEADDWAMSFPHGAVAPRELGMAFDCGYTLCYTSDARIESTLPSRRARNTLGRLHVPENEWTCNSGRIAPAKLATYLFFRPIGTCST